MVLQREVQKFVDRKQMYEGKNEKNDVLVMGKCTKVLIAILESRKDCKSIENDPIDLLEATKEPNHSYQYRKYVIDSVYNNLISLINIKQG